MIAEKRNALLLIKHIKSDCIFFLLFIKRPSIGKLSCKKAKAKQPIKRHHREAARKLIRQLNDCCMIPPNTGASAGEIVIDIERYEFAFNNSRPEKRSL